MRILFDQGTPVPLAELLAPHQVRTAYELGWSTLTNGALLDQAEAVGFTVLVATDQNLRHQQRLIGRGLGVVVLSTASWPRIRLATDAVRDAVDTTPPGTFTELDIP